MSAFEAMERVIKEKHAKSTASEAERTSEFVYVPLSRSGTDIRGIAERVHGEMLEGGRERLGTAIEVA